MRYVLLFIVLSNAMSRLETMVEKTRRTYVPSSLIRSDTFLSQQSFAFFKRLE